MAWGKRASGASDWVSRLQARDPTFTALHVLSFRPFGESDAVQLCSALRTNDTLRELAASGRALSPGALAAFAEMLPLNQGLRSLCIGDDKLGAEGLSVLVPALIANGRLESLDLENKGLGHGSGRLLGQLCAGLSSLRRLSLRRNNLDEAELRDFGDALTTSSRLVELDLSCNPLTPGALEALVAPSGLVAKDDEPALVAFPDLETLRLSECGLGAEASGALAQILCSFPALQHLQLIDNGLGDAALEAFAEAAASLDGASIAAPLTTLDLSGTSLSAAGAAHLARLVEHHPSLTHLILARNELGDEGALALHAVLARARAPLARLHLGQCGITHRGAAPFLSSPRLTHLSFFGNKLGEGLGDREHAIFGTLLGSLNEAASLSDLDLGGNGITDSAMTMWLDLLEDGSAFPALATLGLGGNEIDDNQVWLGRVAAFKEARPSLDVLWKSNTN